MYFVSAYHGGPTSEDGMQQLSYSEKKQNKKKKPTLWGWEEKESKIQAGYTKKKKYEQLTSMSTNAIK